MKRFITTAHVRHHELSDRAVACPNARDESSSYNVKARPGDWIQYLESAPDGAGWPRFGRVLGHVSAPYVPDAKYPCEAFDGLSVLALADDGHYAYIRWVKPADVRHVRRMPPVAFLAWFSGPMPDATIVHKLSAYGTLSESYIGNAPVHSEAFAAGIGPNAYASGIRRICKTCGRGLKPRERCKTATCRAH